MATRRDLVGYVWSNTDYAGRCWLWRGPVNSSGYGRISTGGRRQRRKEYVHRLVYRWTFGDIPQGKIVMHACDTPLCVKPSHLSVGTQTENLADMHRKGRRLYTRPSRCRHGHRYTKENTGWARDGSRRCRECMNAPRRKGGRLFKGAQEAVA